MTKSTSPAGAYAPAESTSASESTSRARQWLGGWRVSLRMARRDIARHRWRSALIATMFGLPVLLMVAGLTVYQTSHVDAREDAPARFGLSQAVVAGRDLGVPQLTDSPREFGCPGVDPERSGRASSDGLWAFTAGSVSLCAGGPPATALPGLETAEPSLGALANVVSRLTGARVVPMSTDLLDVRLGARETLLDVVHIDGADPVARSMVELASGRWARGPDEAVVTDAGQRQGLSASGVINALGDRTSAESSGAARPIAIVGTARIAPNAGPDPALVMAAPTAIEGTVFLIDRGEPVTWADVQRLASYGLVTYSKDVVLDPPDEAPAAPRTANAASGFPSAIGTALLSLALLVQSALLAGPAFAVIAQRARRTLALAAANGATQPQLRRTMLAEALVLGAASACLGALLAFCVAGVAIFAARRLPLDPTPAPDHWLLQLIGAEFGPFDVPWAQVGIVVAFAVLAAVVSALVPTRGLGRVDGVSGLRADVVSPPASRASRRVPVLGGILAAVGSALVYGALALIRSNYKAEAAAGVLLVGGGISLVVGTLLLVPIVLAACAAASGRAPVVVRMAARQASRQRGRSVATVAAVMAGSILLSGSALVIATYERGERALHPPQAPVGQIIVWADLSEQDAVNAEIVATTPGVTMRRVGKLTTDQPADADLSSRLLASTIVFAPPGCAPAQVFADANHTEAPPPPGATPQQSRCSGQVAGWWQAPPGEVVVATVQDATELFDLEASATRTLQAGGIVLAEPDGWVTPPLVRAYSGTASVGGNSGERRWNEVSAQRELPAAAMTPPSFVMPGRSMKSSQIGAVLTPRTAAALGADTTSDVLYVSRPQGMTPQDAARLVEATGRDPRYDIHLERGYHSAGRRFQVGVYALIGLLILVATFTSTALSMGEQRRDLATLGAVGGAPGMRRRLGAVHAAGLAFLGTALGLIVGAVPGVVFSLLLTMPGGEVDGWDMGGYVEVPWLVLLGVLAVVPLLAAGLAALNVARRPDPTRRGH